VFFFDPKGLALLCESIENNGASPFGLGQTHQNNGFDCRSFFWIGIFDFRLKVLEKR
jgi:hypothetical protein